jgi:Family of unknown function (DUF6282)
LNLESNPFLKKARSTVPDVKSLLKGFIDTHVHAGPSLIAREFTPWELVEETEKAGFAAIVFKDHFMPTVSAVRLLQDHYRDYKLKIFGSIALNNAVGGLNPKAAETAIRFGAKVIWMPTTSSANHAKKHRAPGTKFPALSVKEKAADPPITIIDSSGSLSPDAEQILAVLLDNPDVVLATGHLSREEVDVLVRRAFEVGLRRVIVTHPHFMVDATIDDMKTWQSLGAYIEFTAVISLPKSPLYCRPARDVAALIAELDSQKVILSSDLGIKGAGHPVDGMAEFLQSLLDSGLSYDKLKHMVTTNPAAVFGL